jgi:mono/diheme cytochrome c family protein
MRALFLRKPIGISMLIIIGVMSCAKPDHEEVAQKDAVVNIDDYQVNFPKGEGYDEFKAACITCHSLRYIEMQPDFPPKTWETIVTKMRKNFGAPMSDSAATKIVNYLVAVKGKK